MVFGPQALCLTTQINCYFFWYSSSSNCRHILLLKHCCYWGSSSAERWLQWICSTTWITAHLTSTDEAVQVWKKKKKKDMIIRQIQSLIPPPLFSTAFSLSPLWAVEENDSPRVNNKEVYGMWRMWSYSTWNSNEGVTAAWLMLHPNINSHLVLLPSLCRRTHSWRETVGEKKKECSEQYQCLPIWHTHWYQWQGRKGRSTDRDSGGVVSSRDDVICCG